MANRFVALTKVARAEVIRRSIDSSMLNVTVGGTTVHITGVLRRLRTHPEVNLQEEMNLITQLMRQRAGINEVVWDVVIRL